MIKPISPKVPKKLILIKALSDLPFLAPVLTNQQTNIDCFIENLASICFSIYGWALVWSVPAAAHSIEILVFQLESPT